jgi:chromate transporter
MESATDKGEKGCLAEVAKQFLRLGFIAYGGPAAHVAMMEEEFVRRRGWLTRERFLDLLGAVSLLPGPSSTELAIYLGEIRAGLAGLIVAGACFILPAAFLVVALAWAYLKFCAVPEVTGLLFGIKAVVVALIAQAVWSLGKTALRDVPLSALALAVVLLAVAGVPAVWLLIGAGFFWMALTEGKRLAGNRAALGAWIGLGTGGAGGAFGALPIFFYFLKIGAVLVGSGYVLLPVLRSDLVVRFHWLSDSQLLDAVAVSQATPGPFFTVATFIGYILAGWKGAALATLGDVSAGICLRRRHFQLFAEATPIAARGRISGWCQRSRSSAYGLCWLAIWSSGVDQHSGCYSWGAQHCGRFPLQNKFHLAGSWRGRGWNYATSLRLELKTKSGNQDNLAVCAGRQDVHMRLRGIL